MKTLILLAFTIFALPVFSQEIQTSKGNKDVNLFYKIDSDFESNLELIDKVYCRATPAESNYRMLLLRYKLIYKNISSEEIIVNRYVPFTSSIKLNKIKEDGTSIVVSKGIPTPFFSFPMGDEEDAVDKKEEKKNFIYLAPGEEYEIQTLVEDVFPLLESGDYYYEIDFSNTFLKNPNYGKTKPKRYITNFTGYLKFSIEDFKGEKMEKCPDVKSLPNSKCHISVDGRKTCEIEKFNV